MIPILGRLLILGSLFAAAAGAVLGFVAGRTRSLDGLRWARRFAYLYSAFIVLAAVLMEIALLKHDFSVKYVAQVGSRLVPTWVTIVSLWSSLEGSILFWGLVLGIYIAIATYLTRGRYPEYQPDAIGVWLSCAAFFSFLIAGPANPFLTESPVIADGPGPNALLQNHVLMAVHPPFLYLGYVGMTIPFGFACAALMKGRLGHAVLKPLRESLMVPWIFQSIAIMLGGWWAYAVLGWGGYWAWDPVENASLLPWLTATAALHSIMVVERRGILKGWTITLVQSTFLLVILGTFMTRSGVFNSVHSFTQSAIGPTILVFLAAALLFSVVLLATRIDRLQAEGGLESGATRDTMFLVNNLLFVLFTFTVLIGTVFPLLVEALRGTQMSVGRPYFDRMAVPVGAALLLLMGVGPALPWGRATREQVQQALVPPLFGAAIATALGVALGVRSPWTLLTLAFGGFTAQVTLRELWLPVGQRMRSHGEGLLPALSTAAGRGRRRFAGYVIHAAAAVVMVAIAVSSTMGSSKEVSLGKGESTQLGRYTLTFVGADVVAEPHRQSIVAQVQVSRDGAPAGMLLPRMNQYESQREPIGTPAVRSSLFEDLYLSAMNIDPEGQRLGLHAMVNPMVGWIWGATAVMGLGGIAALLPGRRERAVAAALQPAVVRDDLTPATR